MFVLSYSLLGMVAGPLVVVAGFSIARREPTSWLLFYSVGWTASLAASAFLGSALTYAPLVAPRSAALVAWLVIVGLALALVDWTCHRLPHRLVGTLFLGGLVQIGLMAIALRDVEPLLRAGAAAAVVFVAGLLLYLWLGAELGFGDVTLATTLALFLGWRGWPYVASGLTAALVAAGVVTRTLLVLKRISRRDPVALGPSLLAGAVYVMLQI
jgi:leader peptidase (prepilin peptidase) / N-methyltransferase